MKQAPALTLALIAVSLPSVAQTSQAIKQKLAEGIVPGQHRPQPSSQDLAALLAAAPQATTSSPTLQLLNNVPSSVLHIFGAPQASPDGQYPDAAAIFASDGKLYSTTTSGGLQGCGTIFSFDPATQAYTTLYSLDCEKDGTAPIGGLIEAVDGYLYGTTTAFGSTGSEVYGGSIFRYDMATKTLTTLYRFQHGGVPYGDLIDDGHGTLYGTTFSDGSTGNGSVWSWNYESNSFKTLYSFTGGGDGAGPTGGVVLASDGLLYGTATGGGQYGLGTAFSLNTDGTGFQAFYGFSNFALGPDGEYPSADLVEAQDGNLYGTSCCGPGTIPQGAFFQIVPGGANSTLNGLAMLGQSVYPTPLAEGGDVQLGRPLIGGDGYMYISPSEGGSNSAGSVVQMDTFGDASRIYSFQSPYDDFARGPYGGVIEGQDGNLYGVTFSSGYAPGILYALSTSLPAAISLNSSTASGYVSVPLTLDWQVNNAFSLNAAVCVARSTDGTFGGNGQTGLRSIAGVEKVTPLASGTVTYSFTCGGVESATAVVNVSEVPTTTTVVSSPSTLKQGQPAQIGVVVAQHAGSNLPQGTVALVIGGKTLATATLSGGKATFSLPTSSIAPGIHTGYVAYSGSKTFQSSNSASISFDLKVQPTVQFVANPATTTQGLAITFYVALGNTGAPRPTGTVAFSGEGFTFGSAPVTNGIASFVADSAQVPAGKYKITATYSGDNYNEAVSSSQNVTLTRAVTSTGLTGPQTIQAGASASYQVSVARPNVAGVPTGTVTLLAGSTQVGSAKLSAGSASITISSSALPPGSYRLVAQYAGDANNTASASSPLVVTVQ
jgi:uncharacterized repeat protein (TIGR03803 family)